jgi:RHH-type proline utilization regulon transcriptional repressor/proline dehydrogenase/delta 1-pyrroline-5-carboxylate dehydrogenase
VARRRAGGNLYVNRGITGAIVQRQPFGGWKRSSVGAGTKAGGPNYLVGLGSWRPSAGGPSSTLHLRGLDSRITALIEAAQPSLDYEAFEWLGARSPTRSWDREFGRCDVSQLNVERNLFRYRPVEVAVRATADASWQAALRASSSRRCGPAASSPWCAGGRPGAVRRALGDLDVPVFVETDAEWIEPHPPRPGGRAVPGACLVDPRVGRRHETALAEARRRSRSRGLRGTTTAGRIELLPFLHEQADHDHRAPLRQPRRLERRGHLTPPPVGAGVCASTPTDAVGRPGRLATSNSPVPRS